MSVINKENVESKQIVLCNLDDLQQWNLLNYKIN